MKSAIAVLSIAALAVGCATPSAITPYGKDTYIISLDSFVETYPSDTLQVMAAQEADAFCAKQGKALRVRNAAGPYTGDRTRTSASLIFDCIAKGAADSTKPEPRKQ